MRIFGFAKGRAGEPIKHRKTVVDRLKRITEKDLLNIAVKNQKAMATLLGKYCDIWVHDDDGLEATKRKIRDTIYKAAERKVLTQRRRELDYRITDIIGRVIPSSKKPTEGQDEADIPLNLQPGEQNNSSHVTRDYRTSERRFEDRPSLLAFLKGLEDIAAISNLAGNQMKRERVDDLERIYVVKLGEQMVEMTESDYKDYINLQEGIKKASPRNPHRLPPLLPAEKDEELPEV